MPQQLPQPFPTVAANNKIDELVTAKLKRLGIPPSELCADQEFFRRIYLDMLGILPAPADVQAFPADKDPQKRSKLIEALFQREEFADYWAMMWGDLLRIKSEYPVRIWPKGVTTYYRWVRDAVAKNKPYDQFARELLTTNGSNFRRGPANFVRAVSNKDPQTLAETTAMVFMGARFACARCHAHPTESWSINDDVALGAVVAYERQKTGTTGVLPPYITLTSPLGRFSEAGFLGNNYRTFAPGGDPNNKDFRVQGLASPRSVTDARVQERRALLEKLDTVAKQTEKPGVLKTMDAYEQKAYSLILGDAKKAFDLSEEKDELRDKYGRHHFGQSCLLARRLVERGVPFVTINYGGWDTHIENYKAMQRLLPPLEQSETILNLANASIVVADNDTPDNLVNAALSEKFGLRLMKKPEAPAPPPTKPALPKADDPDDTNAGVDARADRQRRRACARGVYCRFVLGEIARRFQA